MVMENIDDPRPWYQFHLLLAKKLQREVQTSLRSVLTTAAALSLGVWKRDLSEGALNAMLLEQGCGQRAAREGKGADLIPRGYGQALWLFSCSLRCKASELDHSNFCTTNI